MDFSILLRLLSKLWANNYHLQYFKFYDVACIPYCPQLKILYEYEITDIVYVPLMIPFDCRNNFYYKRDLIVNYVLQYMD